MNQRLSRPRQLTRRFAGAFTLVELLTVMAIMSVLLAVAVPAMKGINGTGGRKSAVRTIMGALDQARMLAISDGKATYVVFGGKNLVGTNGDVLMGRAYAVFEDNVNFTPVQRSAWQFLPVGISFKVGSDYDSLINRNLGRADPTFFITPPKAGGASFDMKLPYVKFDSTGALDASIANDSIAQNFRILIFQGNITSAGIEAATRTVSGGGADQMVLVDEIRLNPATGRARYTPNSADNLPAKSS